MVHIVTVCLRVVWAGERVLEIIITVLWSLGKVTDTAKREKGNLGD